MAVRDIRLFGDPVLATPSESITDIDDGVRALVEDLIDTVELPGRAGVAAPQIGVNLRAFSYNVDGVIGYVLNPRIVEVRGEKLPVQEGCLSVPEQWHPTPRHEWAKAEGIDLQGNPIVLEGDGLMGQMIQHECDHLDGIVYITRLEGSERKAAFAQLRESSWF